MQCNLDDSQVHSRVANKMFCIVCINMRNFAHSADDFVADKHAVRESPSVFPFDTVRHGKALKKMTITTRLSVRYDGPR